MASPSSDPSSFSSPSSSPPLLIPNLPDDIALQCIARVPRSYHPHLTLVSKSWHSIIRSPLFFSIRTHLNSSQHFLFINVRIPNSSFKWFVLDCNNNNPSSNPKIPKNLFTIPPPIHPQPIGSAFGVLGPKIFVIGGSINEIPSPSVWIFDFRFNKWELGPKMRVGREFAAAGVINGKIYVCGGCLVDSWARSTNWAEVFDPGIGSWAPIPSPVEVRDKWMHASAVIQNKMYAMADRGGVVLNPEESSWGSVSTELDLGWRGRAAVVDGMLFCYDYLGKIRGFDTEESLWKEVKGLDKDLPKFLCGATMANVGEKLCVVWESKGAGEQMEVLCAEISVLKDSSGGLWGTVIWSQVIHVIPNKSSIVHCLEVVL